MMFFLYVFGYLSDVIGMQNPRWIILEVLCGCTEQLSRVKIQKECPVIGMKAQVKLFVSTSDDCVCYIACP